MAESFRVYRDNGNELINGISSVEVVEGGVLVVKDINGSSIRMYNRDSWNKIKQV